MQPISAERLGQSIWDASASRYLTAVGTVVLLYDHVITLPDEYRFVWKAKPSFAKYAFLLNRYVVPSVMLLVLSATCGFGPALSNLQCQCIIFTAGVAAIVSIGIANALVLLRVLVLWQDDRKITRFLWGVYLLSFLVTSSMMLLTCVKALPGIFWFPVTGMCVLAVRVPSLAATWGASLFFEVTVIYFVGYHVLSTPRSAGMPLTRSLRQNGLAFFLTVFALRLGNMFAAIYARPSLVFLTVFCIWSSVTINLNRSLLRLRRADVKHYLLTGNSAMHHAASPFGLYRASVSPDFDQDVLDEFDDIKAKAADELRLQSFEILSRRPREITIRLGNTASAPQQWRSTQGWYI
ncbi:hypothetical protein BDM02DRAFT_1819799 [Thelephora ganbajun]|uniref:Uncharacterized protein n=1 Tax=Thelephora ganbajun TaxID=370292 RepID=A0ACB6ZI33_THEGA|nr:hypothetical protein BDM02DRAFT_1819799 [Thelephora ganbajun]